jgi:hypothetical protein
MGVVDLGTKTFTVRVAETAKKGSFDVAVEPNTVKPGDTVYVKVYLTNPNPFKTDFLVGVGLFGKKLRGQKFSVDPGKTVEVKFPFTAPSTPGNYSGYVHVAMVVPDDYIVPT